MRNRPFKRHRQGIPFLRSRFWRRHGLKVLIAAAAAVVLLLLLFFVVLPNVQKSGEVQKDPTQQEIDASYEGVDQETLDGLAGAGAAVAKEQLLKDQKIGVSALNTQPQDTTLLSSLEKASAEDVKSGTIADFYLYDAQGDQNQQIQDVFTMVNNGVGVLIVVNTDEYNFAKIADIASKNNIRLVTYATQAQTGFAVNVKESQNTAVEFAKFLKGLSIPETDVLKATEEQVAQMSEFVKVTARYEDIWDAVAATKASIDAGAPKQSMVVMDYNGADVLKGWLSKSTFPRAYAAVGTANYIKMWYALLNGGYQYTPETVEGQPPPAPIVVQATPEQFAGCSVTAVQNVGDILYTFARHLAMGDTLPQENYVYEMAGYQVITNENLAQFYEQVKDQEGGLVYSTADTKEIASLFVTKTAPSEQPTDQYE